MNFTAIDDAILQVIEVHGSLLEERVPKSNKKAQRKKIKDHPQSGFKSTSRNHDTWKMGKIVSKNEQVNTDELVNNGLVLNGTEMPPELIENILFYVDVKSLLKCRRVCKYWNEVITHQVWRKKAENRTGFKFTTDTALGWKEYYLICSELFGRNFVKNHSGKEKFKYWHITDREGDGWAIECPPIGAPLLSPEPEFENKQHCFVTSYGDCLKIYTVDLIREGFTTNILDQLQPSIEVS